MDITAIKWIDLSGSKKSRRHILFSEIWGPKYDICSINGSKWIYFKVQRLDSSAKYLIMIPSIRKLYESIRLLNWPALMGI